MVESNFVKADSRNLLTVNLVTVWKFFQIDDRFNARDVRAAKTFK